MAQFRVYLAIGCCCCIAVAGADLRRIMNGRNADDGQFPYQTALFYASTGTHLCGGALIAPQRVLTAAHCVTTRQNAVLSPILFAVQAGTVMRSSSDSNGNRTAESPQVRRIRHIAVHPTFLRHGPHADLAVLQLLAAFDMYSEPPLAIVRLGNDAQLGEPAADDSSPPQPQRCTITGWGRTLAGDRPAVLQWADVRLVARAECARQLAQPIGADMLCALGAQRQDAAAGDSGGPLVCDGQLVGVVSFGAVGADADGGLVPGVYARVAVAREWIETAGLWSRERLARGGAANATGAFRWRWWGLCVLAAVAKSRNGC